jgi:hypothetical protein
MKTTYKLVLSLGVIFALALTSCLKDDMVESQKYGMINLNAKKIVEIPSGSSRSQTFALPIQTAAQSIETTVHLAAENVAAEDVNVTLSVAESETLLAAYNTANTTTYTLLPTSLYTLPNGLGVTIPKGEKDATFTVNVTTSAFDPSKTYALFVKVASVDKAGYTISGNYGYKMLLIGAKNNYDGIYSFSGYIRRDNSTPDYTGNFSGKTITLATLDANTVTTITTSHFWASNLGGVGGIEYLKYTVDPATNLVTVSSTTNATLVNEPSYNSRYVPATKTFYVSFKWGTPPNTRAATDTLIYSRSR